MASSSALPKSFEDRGCVVGFSKSSIKMARLRARRDDSEVVWEIMVPMNKDRRSASVMIMPWRQLAAYTSLTPRDIALHKAIDGIEDDFPDPLAVRLARLTVDAAVGENPEIKRDAQQLLARERRDRLNVYISLLAQMTREAGIALGDTFMSRADTKLLMEITQGTSGIDIDGGALTKKVLDFHAEKVGVAYRDVNARLEAITDQAAVFGSMNLAENAPRDGLFYRMKLRIMDFENSLAAFEGTAVLELQNMAMVIRFASRDFIKYIDEKTSQVEQILSNFSTILTESERVMSIVKKARRDVAYALDGWDNLVDAWFAVEGSEVPSEKAEALQFIINNLPMMPVEEMEGGTERSKVWKGFNVARTGVIRAMVSWGDNAVDQEMVDRINRAKEAEKERAESNAAARGKRRR